MASEFMTGSADVDSPSVMQDGTSSMAARRFIPIIDLFAGPGGLGEGFSALANSAGEREFRIALSVEKDEVACQTLKLRAIRRHLLDAGGLDPYYSLLRGEIDRATFDALPLVRESALEADSEVINEELGKCAAASLDARIRKAIGGATDWILIGGPPCQAYSLAGRARRTNDKAFEADEKHFLYREYIRIIKVHAPPVFVMENVKGLLSSHHGGVPMFSRICGDLANPARGLSYEIRSLVMRDIGVGLNPDDYIIESERFGIPQTRHRVILLGVRSDLAHKESGLLTESGRVSVKQVLGGLPRIRSRLSRGNDSVAAWHQVVRDASSMVRGWGATGEKRLIATMNTAARAASDLDSTGAPFITKRGLLTGTPKELTDWLGVPGLGGAIQHEGRGHMATDIARYLFAASFAQEFGYSPNLNVFPGSLLPNHENARDLIDQPAPFLDRFRVQCAERPSTTVVSHIAKDGHYYIHYDPSQCRSLTVREAARLQTFPDDYFFEGNRTQQYAQVGNAVPPLLAKRIAEVVHRLIRGQSAAERNHRFVPAGLSAA